MCIRDRYYREALNYLNRFWKEIFTYLDDGELPIDNSLAEMCIRDSIIYVMLLFKLATPQMASITIILSLNAVSYTHLDVYKRQSSK